jgi:hypothetical protein
MLFATGPTPPLSTSPDTIRRRFYASVMTPGENSGSRLCARKPNCHPPSCPSEPEQRSAEPENWPNDTERPFCEDWLDWQLCWRATPSHALLVFCPPTVWVGLDGRAVAPWSTGAQSRSPDTVRNPELHFSITRSEDLLRNVDQRTVIAAAPNP